MLLAHGACAGVEDIDGNTPLHTLMASRRVSSSLLIALLLRAGANVNITNALGFTPLHIACTQGHTDAVQVLVNVGADVNARCRQGSPISLCVWGHGNSQIIACLLRAGACLQGENLLHHVLRAANDYGDDRDRVQLMAELIELGCDVEEVDERGATPLHYAVLHRRTCTNSRHLSRSSLFMLTQLSRSQGMQRCCLGPGATPNGQMIWVSHP